MLPSMYVGKSFHKVEDAVPFASKQTQMEIEQDPRMRHLQMFKNFVEILKLSQSDTKSTGETTVCLDTLLTRPKTNKT